MPSELIMLDNGLGFWLIFQGEISGRDIISGIDGIFPRSTETFDYKYGIIDYTEARGSDVTSSEIQYMARQCLHAEKVCPDLTVAIVAKYDLSFGLNRMWQVYLGNLSWETNILRSRQEAYEWIREKSMEKHGIEVKSPPKGIFQPE